MNAIYTPIPYTATFVADGKAVDTAEYTVESMSIDEPQVPAKIGYTGTWEPYTFDVSGITVNAVYTLIGNPSVQIVDYRPLRTVWYHKTLTYKANAVDVPAGAEIHWFLNGEDVGTGNAYTAALATDDYTIQAKIVSADGTVFPRARQQTFACATTASCG